jgi:hypothetical protein
MKKVSFYDFYVRPEAFLGSIWFMMLWLIGINLWILDFYFRESRKKSTPKIPSKIPNRFPFKKRFGHHPYVVTEKPLRVQ